MDYQYKYIVYIDRCLFFIRVGPCFVVQPIGATYLRCGICSANRNSFRRECLKEHTHIFFAEAVGPEMNFGRGGGHMGGGGGMAQPPPGILGGGPPSASQQQPIIGEPFIPGQSTIKTRDILYRLVISQLFYDGYQQVAVALSNIGRFSKKR